MAAGAELRGGDGVGLRAGAGGAPIRHGEGEAADGGGRRPLRWATGLPGPAQRGGGGAANLLPATKFLIDSPAICHSFREFLYFRFWFLSNI